MRLLLLSLHKLSIRVKSLQRFKECQAGTTTSGRVITPQRMSKVSQEDGIKVVEATDVAPVLLGTQANGKDTHLTTPRRRIKDIRERAITPRRRKARAAIGALKTSQMASVPGTRQPDSTKDLFTMESQTTFGTMLPKRRQEQ